MRRLALLLVAPFCLGASVARTVQPASDLADCTYYQVGDLFIIFFDLDSAAIRPDAAQTLDNAVRNFARFPRCIIRVVGHADRSGTAAHNLALSRRRAQSVADYFRGQGIISPFALEALGDTRPLVDTPPGARERENRRAEILIEQPGTPH